MEAIRARLVFSAVVVAAVVVTLSSGSRCLAQQGTLAAALRSEKPDGGPQPPDDKYKLWGLATVTCPAGSGYAVTIEVTHTPAGGSAKRIKAQTIFGSSSGLPISCETDSVKQVASPGDTVKVEVKGSYSQGTTKTNFASASTTATLD